MSEKFNGVGRDCPLCYRLGTLVGRVDDGATVQCSGCANCFRVDGSTLERLPVAHPTGRPLSHRELGQVRGGAAGTYRAPLRADEPCKVCGRKHCAGHPQEEFRR